MPMVRYEIRNEYSLADPELHQTADKDDPEALLEGVAMAGLVGVLRQLGDLAEFAAEIFHNLHEEVMATAARGHGLMIRVQQLETEVPSIERAFLSQTDHSSFFNNAGVDWHPNLQIDQNLVTQRDLPRFIMDSYEECRAPPRLFLLDKFDVAGAGACLKRYTDPSFFKVETSEMATADVQREKKIRKAKKKGPRWRNGETPEVQPTTHAKLHQLFLEERVENGVGNPSRRAQLKRRLNGFPFDSKHGKSYMEKILKSPSPDHKVLHEVTLNSSPLMLATNDRNKSALDVLEVRPVRPERESVERKRSPPSSPDRDEIMLNSSMYETSEVPIDDKISELPNVYPSIGTDSFSSTKVAGEKVIAVDAESNRRDGLTGGDQSDGFASEVDNYVDAPSTMESEMDMDSDFKVKSDFTYSQNKNQLLASDANEEHFHTSSSDSQSTGDSTISDEGNNSSRQEMYCSSSSNSPSISAENLQSEEFSVKGFPSADVPVVEIADESSHKKTVSEDFPVDQHSKHVVPDDACPGTDATATDKSDPEQLSSCLCSNQSMYTTVSSDSGVVRNGMLKGPESDEMAPNLADREQNRNLAVDPPCSPSVSDFESRSGDDSPGSSSGELVGESNDEILRSMSTVPGIHSQTTDGTVTISSNLLHEDESVQEHQNLAENIASPSNKLNVLSLNTNSTPEMISSEILIQSESDDEFSKLHEGFPSDYPDIAHNGENIKSMVSKGEYPIDELDNESSNVSSNAPNCNLEDSLGKKLEETSPVDAQIVDAEDTQSNNSIGNHISSENGMLSHLANFLDLPRVGSDAHEGDVIAEEVTTVNETLPPGTPKTCEVVGLQGTGITSDIFHNDPEALGSSLYTPEDIEEPGGTSDAVEKDGISPCTNSTGPEIPEMSDSADPESVNEVDVLLDESLSEVDKSHTADMASAMPLVSGGAIVDNVLDKLVEEHIHCFEDSGLDELENDKSCLSESHGEAIVVEEVNETKDATSGLETVFCNTTNDDHPKSEVLDTVPNSHLDELENDKNSLSESPGEASIVEKVSQTKDATSRLETVFCNTTNDDHPKSEVSDTVPNSHLDELENDKNCLSESHGEASIVEKVNQTKDATSGLETVFCNTTNDDHPKSEVSDTVPNSHLDFEVDHSLDFVHAAAIQPLMEQSGLDTEQEVFQQSSLGNHFSDALNFPVDYEAEESIEQEKTGLPPCQLDQEIPHSGEISSELSPSLPNNHQQMPDHDDHKGDNNSASTFSLVNSQGPPVSDISRPSNYGLSVPGYPKDPLGFILPPSNLFSGTNQISMDDLPPLPPLPPVQWRMGKLQHASSSTEGEMTKHKESIPHLVSPLTASSNDVSSSQLAASTGAVCSSPPTTSTDEASFLVDEEKHPLVQIAPETASEEKAENSCSSVTACIIPETDSGEEKVENGCSSLEARAIPGTISKEEKAVNSSSSLEAVVIPETISKEEKAVNSSSSLEAGVIPETISKEGKVENSSSTLKAKVLHERVDLTPKIENTQQQLVMPTSESEFTSPAMEDGAVNGNRTVKLPRPRNPLIDDVAALDKSKLRKVTERVRPQVQKVDERDSLLEQIRTKSFNLKPAMGSRPSIRGPNTNLRVAAILEKANAIRQAFAGSDEDDDDSWSDS